MTSPTQSQPSSSRPLADLDDCNHGTTRTDIPTTNCRPTSPKTPLATTSSSPPAWSSLFPQPPEEEPVDLHYVPPMREDGQLVVQATESMIAGGLEIWKRCLVGFFMGSSLPFKVVQSITNKLWGKYGLQEVRVSNHLYYFRFASTTQLHVVLDKGPWILGGKYLALQQWRPDASFDKQCSVVPTWVRLYNLPLYLWSANGLSAAASAVGIPRSVDRLTLTGTKTAYARICVELDARHDLVSSFLLRTVDNDSEPIPIEVQYEWRPTRCPSCNVFGHRCPEKEPTTPAEPSISNSPPTAQYLPHRNVHALKANRAPQQYHAAPIPSFTESHNHAEPFPLTNGDSQLHPSAATTLTKRPEIPPVPPATEKDGAQGDTPNPPQHATLCPPNGEGFLLQSDHINTAPLALIPVDSGSLLRSDTVINPIDHTSPTGIEELEVIQDGLLLADCGDCVINTHSFELACSPGEIIVTTSPTQQDLEGGDFTPVVRKKDKSPLVLSTTGAPPARNSKKGYSRGRKGGAHP